MKTFEVWHPPPPPQLQIFIASDPPFKNFQDPIRQEHVDFCWNNLNQKEMNLGRRETGVYEETHT